MAEVHKRVLIDSPAETMFELVDRCEDYPEFLPWCGGVELHRRTDEVTEATLHVDFHGIKTHFTTVNEKEFPHRMRIRLKEGPFRRLEGEWRFVPLGEQACRVEFDLSYEFSSRVLEKVLGPVFNRIAATFIDAFVRRARQIKGEGSD
ncbi:type II toxin-antitoxin system RatA family toxin [Tepidiphilus olei]|uniref:type II toxin-antitoxin system RatA family toxin n=1 Tax=Tepidiphilus olei TaxID=2502184 RepID=UPI00115CEC22|nr:type II toxin-antitoxin system RatA family toxin [Tepidiphilus olei]